MLKEQNEWEVYCCLNPFCSDGNNRHFSCEHSHFKREECKKWTLPYQQLLISQPLPYTIKQMENVAIDFQSSPISAFKNIERLSISDWKKRLQLEQAKTKKELCKCIEIQFERMSEQIQQLLLKASTFRQIRRLGLLAGKQGEKINEYYSSHFEMTESYVLFKKQEFKEKVNQLKLNIEAMFSLLKQSPTPAFSLLKHEEQRAFHDYIFQQTDQYYNKLQTICASLAKPTPPYHLQNQQLTLKCCLCSRGIHCPINPANKKQVKKFLAQQILYHLHSNHYSEVAFAYSRKIAKTAIQDISFQQFLIASRNSETVQIVDRLSGVSFEGSYQQLISNPLTFTIEIVSNQNIAMARGLYIAVSTHEAIDYLIAIICYSCSQRNQNVEILSKKPQLKLGLNALLWLKVGKDGKADEITMNVGKQAQISKISTAKKQRNS